MVKAQSINKMKFKKKRAKRMYILFFLYLFSFSFNSMVSLSESKKLACPSVIVQGNTYHKML